MEQRLKKLMVEVAALVIFMGVVVSASAGVERVYGKTVQVAVSYDYSQQQPLKSSRFKAKVAGLGRN